MADKIKFALALLLVVAGIAGFYLLRQQGMASVFQVLSVLIGLGAGAAVAWFTEPGQRFFAFAADARDETKKVVWPSRKEATQMTAIVFGFVLVMAIVLWLTDKTVEWVVYDLILGWK
jgi:preprotein translocase subunit SecE